MTPLTGIRQLKIRSEGRDVFFHKSVREKVLGIDVDKDYGDVYTAIVVISEGECKQAMFVVVYPTFRCG